MVNQLDTSALDPNGFTTLRAQNTQNALNDQKVQAGDLANQAAAHAHAVQVLSEAVASGDQGIYDNAKNGLAQMGINVSNLAPDIQTGSSQVQAARNALYNSNPLNALLGMGLHAEGNLNSATSALGSTGAAAAADPLSASIANRLQNVTLPGGAPVQAPAAPVSSAPGMPSATPAATQPAQNTSNSGMDMRINSAAVSPEAEYAATANGGQPPAAAPAAMPPQIPVSNLPQGAIDVNGSTATHFEPPKPVQGETAAVTQNKTENAFKAWQANPAVQKASKSAENSGGEEGKDIGELQKTVDIMQANLPIALKRFQTMRDAAQGASSGFGVDPESGMGWKDSLQNSLVGSSDVADANGVLQQRAAQGILPELGPALAQAGVKGNKFLEGIANSASGLKMNAPADTKVKLIDGLELQYINNLKASSAALRAKGQPAPSDKEIDDAAAQYAGNKNAQTVTPQIIAKIPAQAVGALRADPSKAAEFDQWYGNGASQQILGAK